MEIEGVLGIIEILGAQHLMVILEKSEVLNIPHTHYPILNTTASIFELQEIEIIPFINKTDASHIPEGVQIESYQFQVNAIREGIKKFLECGFYVASQGFDLTSNSQRREKLLAGQDPEDFDGLKSVDYRYMWNYNLYKQFRL